MIAQFKKASLFLLLITFSFYILACQKGVTLKHQAPIKPPSPFVSVSKTGTVKVKVLLPGGSPSKNTKVKVFSPKGSLFKEGQTNEKGEFTITPEEKQAGEWKAVVINKEGDRFPKEFEIGAKKEIALNLEAKYPELKMTEDNITITIAYWRKYALDRKYNRGSMTSPFYYEGAWHQGEKLDVFYVTITNNRKTPTLLDVTDCMIVDQRESEYSALSYEENRKRLEYKKGHDITIENGLKKSKQILLQMSVADEEIEPGETVEGFLPFRQVKSIAKELDVKIILEKTPEKAMERYKQITFNFPFIHDKGIRTAQPATMRF